MSALTAVFRLLARIGLLAVTAPVLLVWAAFYLFVATTIGLFLLVLIRQFVLDLPILDRPSTLLDWIANVVIYGSAWAAALVVWAEHTGVALWFGHGPGDSHGSARFASDRERGRLEAGDGLLIGRNPATGRLLRYDGPAHLLTLAPTRAGKGVGTVIPNLLLAKRSVLVIDPKGENGEAASRKRSPGAFRCRTIAGAARQRFGTVHVLDPFEG